MSQPSVIRLTDRAVRDAAVARLKAHLPVAVAGIEAFYGGVFFIEAQVEPQGP